MQLLYHRGVTLTPVLPILLALGCAGHRPGYRSPRPGSVALFEPRDRAPASAPAAGAPSLALLPFVDMRPDFHRGARPSRWKVPGGIAGEAPTREDAWSGALPRLAAEDLAERLRASGRFSRVERVAPGAAVGTDLVLRARLRRLRGLVGYHVDAEGRIVEAEGFGEAFLDRIEIVARESGALRFIGQAGARVDLGDPRIYDLSVGSSDQGGIPDPYRLAREAWGRAAAGLVARIAADPLDRALAREVHLPEGARGDLAALAASLPEGWVPAPESPPPLPVGWTWKQGERSGKATREARGQGSHEAARESLVCEASVFHDPTRVFFQPQLGDFHPSLTLWVCPPGSEIGEIVLAGGTQRVRFPADLVGVLEGGETLFVLTLGKSSWPGAAREIVTFLGGHLLVDSMLESRLRGVSDRGGEAEPGP